MKISGLIFDLDGLLIDSERIYHRVSYKMAGEMKVHLTDEILALQMGRSPVESMEIFIRETGAVGYQAEEMAGWRDELMLAAFEHELALMPGALEILQKYHNLLPIAMATGSPKILMDRAIDLLNIRSYFKVLQPSDGIKLGKPHPEIYMLAAQKMDVPAEECVVLEDSSNGSLAGKRAGCRVIAVPNDHTRDHDFSFVDAVADNLTQASSIIQEWLNGPPAFS